MYKFFDIPINRKIHKIIKKYWINKESSFFMIPFNEIPYKSDYRILSCYSEAIQNYFNFLFENIATKCYLCYYTNIIIVSIGDAQMAVKYSVEIPYKNRDDYINFAIQINHLISKHGTVSLFVNNNPYSLQALLTIESDNQADDTKIQSLIKQYKLHITNEKGFDELFEEMKYRKCNVNILGIDDYSVQSAFKHSFFFTSQPDLEKKGYQNKKDIKRKKVFISYCHNDKETVWNIIDYMQKTGLDFWIDKQDINVGENILRRILSGIDECDLALLFISQSTIKSNFANAELDTIMSAMVKKEKGWYIVKLDNVNPDSILPGLSNYLYYDFTKNNNITDLVNSIKEKLEST